jgi:hypothetical protein
VVKRCAGGVLGLVPGINAWLRHRAVVADLSPAPRLSAFDAEVELDLALGEFGVFGVAKDALNGVSDFALLADREHGWIRGA